MRAELSRQVDPIVLFLLERFELLSEGRSSLTGPEFHDRIIREFSRSEREHAASEAWEFAKYALVAWCDETLMAMPLQTDALTYFSNNRLEQKIFHDTVASTMFYHKAREAMNSDLPDAVEVFFACVAMGFQGDYGGDAAQQHSLIEEGFPPTRSAWLKDTALYLQSNNPTRQIQLPPEGTPFGPARPLRGRRRLVTTTIWALVAFLSVLAGLAWNR